jgi:hypothetical protein
MSRIPFSQIETNGMAALEERDPLTIFAMKIAVAGYVAGEPCTFVEFAFSVDAVHMNTKDSLPASL